MTKQKTVHKLEAIIDALEESKKVPGCDSVETERIIDQIIDYQLGYRKLTGRYYSGYKEGEDESRQDC